MTLLHEADDALETAFMDDTTKPENPKFWAVTKEILSCEDEVKQIPRNRVTAILNSSELSEKLRWSNVFAYHKTTDTIGFQSRPIQLAAEIKNRAKEENDRIQQEKEEKARSWFRWFQ